MNKRIKHFLIPLLCCLLLFTLAACGKNNAESNNNNSEEPKGAQARDTIKVAIGGDNGTLVPASISGGFVGVVRQYMEVLVDFKADGEPVWVLATDIEEVSTEKWIIHLREGVTFSNGNKFDANDVWFTFEYYLSDPMRSMFLSCFDLENSKLSTII